MTTKRRKRMVASGVGVAGAAGMGTGLANMPVTFALGIGGKQGNVNIPKPKIDLWTRRALGNLPGYTILPGRGQWGFAPEGREPTRRIIYSGKLKEYPKMRKIARSYSQVFKQQATLLSVSPTITRFVGAEPGKLAHTLGRLMRLRRMVPR